MAVRIAACAVCHSDIACIDGAWGSRLPAVYGHEAAGVVAETGSGVAGRCRVNCIQGSLLAGARQIIAAGRVAAKLEAALVFGATQVIDSTAGDIGGTVSELTEGRGADHVFVAAGAASLIEIGSSLLRRGGSLVIVGLPPAGAIVSLDPLAIADGSLRVLGSKMGAARRSHQPRDRLGEGGRATASGSHLS